MEERKRLSEEDAQAEAEKVKELIDRRKIIGTPIARDYDEAHTKIERQRSESESESKELQEGKPIEELFDLAIFDWDGTMYDSVSDVSKAVSEILKHFGKEISPDLVRQSMDHPYWDYYHRLGIPAGNEEERAYIYNVYHEKVMPAIKEGGSNQATIYPEIADTLRELATRNLKVVILSAHKAEEISKILEQEGLSDYVVKVVGLAHHKTEEIRALCEEFGATPERTIMIGDLPNDLRGAVAANVRTALVARTEDVRDKLSSYDPDYLFETLGPELFHPKPHKDE